VTVKERCVGDNPRFNVFLSLFLFLGKIIDSGAGAALPNFPREDVVILKPKISYVPSHLSKRGQKKYLYRGHH